MSATDATRTTIDPRDGRAGPARRAVVHPAPAAPERVVGGGDVRLARDAEGQARARAGARRDGHARPVPGDVHLPVRRRRGRRHRRVPAVHPPGHPRPVGALHRRLRGRRAEHRRDQGRRRPLPHAADLAAGAARRRRARRQRPLPARVGHRRGARLRPGLLGGRRRRRRRRRRSRSSSCSPSRCRGCSRRSGWSCGRRTR